MSVRDAEGGEATPSFGHPSNVRRGETTPSFGHPSNVRRGETTPSFGHPSNVRRGEGGTAFGGERSEVHLPLSLLIGGKGGCIPPNRREGRCSPTLPNEPNEAKRVGRVRRGHALKIITKFFKKSNLLKYKKFKSLQCLLKFSVKS